MRIPDVPVREPSEPAFCPCGAAWESITHPPVRAAGTLDCGGQRFAKFELAGDPEINCVRGHSFPVFAQTEAGFHVMT